MPLPRVILDDRSYAQLRDELVQRIPVYAPEWTDHNASDPGITLIELFAFLGENLLYRFNQIPETARLEFLRLLQIPLRPAQPARALVALATEQEKGGVLVEQGKEAKAGKVLFETRTEVRVLPVAAVAVSKQRQDKPEDPEIVAYYDEAIRSLGGLDAQKKAVPYGNELLATDGEGPPVDFDQTVDGMLWVAVLNELDGDLDERRKDLAGRPGTPLLFNLGFIPDTEVPTAAEVGPCPGAGSSVSPEPAVEWQISGLDDDGELAYRSLRVVGDTTRGLSREGVVRLELPRRVEWMTVAEPDPPALAGTGEWPPQLEDEEQAAKVLFWLRAFRHQGEDSGFSKVLWVGANAAEVEQSRLAGPEFLGLGNGQPNQTAALVHKSVLAGSLALEVEEGDGWQTWQEVDGLHASGESDHHYVLDREAGTVRFGNGITGLLPQLGQRIRALEYRYGDGAAGNVAAGAINKIEVGQVEIENPLPAHDGADDETLEEALERLPGELRRRDRAVTEEDFEELAGMTPGAQVGRAECLPRFHPTIRKSKAAGVVTVVVWPAQDRRHPNAPRPDRHLLECVCRWLDSRRLVTTELFVVPPTYRKVAVSVGIEVEDGYGVEAVRNWTELVIRQYLAPLPPYGPSGDGWPLGRRLYGPELEAAALQVEGVRYLEGLNLSGWNEKQQKWLAGTVELEPDEVPELAEITVVEGKPLAEPGKGLTPPSTGKTPVPVPIPREEC